jgi:hypothetical protein
MLCGLATSVDFGAPERLLQGGEFAWLKDRSWLSVQPVDATQA